MSKLYRNSELSDQDHDDYVFPHIMAMTAEKLHSKAEIAHELGVRDKRIAELEELVIDLLDGYSADDLFYGKGFSEEDAVKAIDLLQKCLKNERNQNAT